MMLPPSVAKQQWILVVFQPVLRRQNRYIYARNFALSRHSSSLPTAQAFDMSAGVAAGFSNVTIGLANLALSYTSGKSDHDIDTITQTAVKLFEAIDDLKSGYDSKSFYAQLMSHGTTVTKARTLRDRGYKLHLLVVNASKDAKLRYERENGLKRVQEQPGTRKDSSESLQEELNDPLFIPRLPTIAEEAGSPTSTSWIRGSIGSTFRRSPFPILTSENLSFLLSRSGPFRGLVITPSRIRDPQIITMSIEMSDMGLDRLRLEGVEAESSVEDEIETDTTLV
ncbi:hypothetical protein H0H93_004700 [Arthromyces matolae]|nr:hypothetical protein H0H93_004700 [Arthromyces matolae]